MSRITTTALLTLLLACGSCYALTSAAAAPTAWRLDQVPTAVFADHDEQWRVELAGDLPRDAFLAWEATVNDRTIARGEARWELPDEGPHRASLVWRTPPIKDGVIFAARCTLVTKAAGRTLAETSFDVWIFPREPFAQRRQWLKERNLVVFATDDETITFLDRAAIPCRRLANLVAIERLTNEVLIVTEQVSSEKNRALSAKVEDFVARGGHCLWLAPAAGFTFFAPRESSDSAMQDRWERIELRRRDVIAELDKRLDARTWLPSVDDHSRFQIAVRRLPSGASAPMWEATTAANAWPWIEARSTPGGRLVLCGYPLFKHWERGPTPRYLFARILETYERNVGDPRRATKANDE